MTDFPSEPRLNRNHLIGIVLVLVAFTALILSDHYRLTRATDDPAEVVRRWRTVELGYCNAADIRPCITAFTRVENGMRVSILLPTSTYPEFYLAVQPGEASPLRYECQKDEHNPRNAQCTGAELLPGASLQFTLVSLDGNTLLAEGRFAIIGLMLFTPEVEATATPPATEPPADTESPPATRTPSLVLPTPTRATPTVPAYPNPSYPNP